MRLLHELAKIHASFDDPDLVWRAGPVPVMALTQQAGLAAPVDKPQKRQQQERHAQRHPQDHLPSWAVRKVIT